MAKAAPPPSCDSCFFKRHALCALDEQQACATYRPFSGDRLAPPRQMRFAFRQERRTRTVWAFPDARAQAAARA